MLSRKTRKERGFSPATQPRDAKCERGSWEKAKIRKMLLGLSSGYATPPYMEVDIPRENGEQQEGRGHWCLLRHMPPLSAHFPFL